MVRDSPLGRSHEARDPPRAFQNPRSWRIPSTRLYAETLKFVVEAEHLGIDEVWLAEHHFVVEDGYCPSPMPVAAAIAARTSTIRIGTKVVVLPFRDPVWLAEDIAVTHAISGGRLDLGLAVGYRAAELAGFDVDRRRLGEVMEEGPRQVALAHDLSQTRLAQNLSRGHLGHRRRCSP